MAARLVEVDLGGGAVALVRAVEIAEEDEDSGAEKVGWRDRFDLTDVTDMLDGVAQSLRAAAESAKPSKMTVELGIELAVKSGKLTGIIVEGSGTASLKVTLEWQRGPGG